MIVSEELPHIPNRIVNPPALTRIDAPLSPFDEARAEITRWEKKYPDGIFLALVMVVSDGFEYTLTGERTTTEAAGVFFRAAQLAAE